MSKDTIYRGDAIDEMERIMADHPLQGYEDELLLIDAIKSLPSADRPQGEWELECDGEGECDNLYRCPFCGNRVGREAYDKPKFCDECGADMRGEQNV